MVIRHIEPYLGQAIRLCGSVAARLFREVIFKHMQFWRIAGCAELRTRMRNIILVIFTGPILFGCLTSEESIATGDNTSANSTSGNSAPTIAGTPAASTKHDEGYEFEPTASDADGDILSFDVQNKPTWANFDSSTGRLYGRPLLADIGEYNGIVVSVSDGTNSTSLPEFSITVSQTAIGVVTLSWVAPTQNSDGSALMDLAGYKIFYRKNSGPYDQEIRIDSPGLTTYVVEQLSPATYHFRATAFNSSGIESSFSAEVARTVQ